MRGKLDTYRQPNRIILRRASSFQSILVNLVYRNPFLAAGDLIRTDSGGKELEMVH